MSCVPRLIGDSQTERWYDSIECFLSEFLNQEPRVAPFYETSANLWLMNLDERLEHRGSFWAPPKPSICALYKVRLHNLKITRENLVSVIFQMRCIDFAQPRPAPFRCVKAASMS
jgi:hypothetical protein